MAALAIIEGVGNMPGIAWLEATDAIGDNEAVGKVTLDSFCNFSDPWFSLNNGKGPPGPPGPPAKRKIQIVKYVLQKRNQDLCKENI